MKTKHAIYLTPVFALFLLSGATGLAYEVIWTRMLVRVFGATSFAVSTVLASYMAGLALGSYLFGRMIDKHGKPILTYGLLELGIGVFALIFPALLATFNPLYRSLYVSLEGKFYVFSVIRFALSFLVLLIPTTLMGGTLPVLSRYVTGSLSNLTFRVGWLYSINTFGAVIGTFGTGFVLLPALGMKMTTYAAIGANMAIFVMSLLLSKAAGESPRPVVKEEIRPRAAKRPFYEKAVLAAFLFTGLAALSAEVIWTRVLTLVVGTTVYAFSTMLTTFLLGLALGSAVFARVAQRSSRPRTLFALLVLAIGFVVFASTVAFGKLPIIYMTLYESMGRTWQDIITVQFLLSLGLMIVPTFLMGGTFPLVARIYATDISRVGGRIGTAYAFNTIGSICGSFIGSFILLRVLGVEKGMIAASVIYLAVGLILYMVVSEKIRSKMRIAGSSVVAAGVILMMLFSPGWDKKLMTSAVYVYASLYGTVDGLKDALKTRHLLFYDEGAGATISVERQQTVVSTRIDGKIDASSGGDMITQELISHLPLLLHPQPDTVLIIGLGSGVSVGSALAHDIKHVDCVELLDNVVDAARFYDDYNRRCLSDPRLNLIVGDGRNHVLLTDKTYDVIISQPTNPWISGVGDLFTVEFFQEARGHLKSDGLMCAWFQTYHMGDEELRPTLKAFVSLFPHSALWFSNESDVILVGSLSPITIDALFAGKMKESLVRDDLGRVQIDEVTDLLSALLLNEADLKSFAGKASQIHTDDNMLVEFNAGRRIFESTHIIHLSNFLGRLKPHHFENLDSETNEKVRDQVTARQLTMKGSIERINNRLNQAVGLYEKAYSLAPNDPYVVSKYVEVHIDIADAYLLKYDYDQAIGHYEKALISADLPSAWAAYDGMAICYLLKEQYEDARDNFSIALELNPYNAMGHFHLAQALVELGDTLGAMESYERALELAPWEPDIANNLAWFHAVRGTNLDRALELAKIATKGEPNASYLDTLGWVYFKMGDMRRAQSSLNEALAIDPTRTESIYHLALVHRAKGEDQQAAELLREILRLDSSDEFKARAGVILDEIGKD